MGIKVSTYKPTSSIDTSEKSTVTNTTEEQSFQDVLVLNQTALKAMTIDAMVKQSASGAVNPDSVDAAAIMKFRGTLGPNVKAPIPEKDPDLGTPVKAQIPSVTPESTPVVDETEEQDTTPSAETLSSVPNTGVLECSDELNQYFQQAADAYGLDVKFLKCIAYAESNFRSDATSRSGAMGIMQLMPKTAEGLGVRDAYDPQQNIMGGAKYISIQLERFDGNMEYALAAYNAGPNRVKEYGGIPPFEETQNYVKKIMNVYNS